jgi:hypothetical protein
MHTTKRYGYVENSTFLCEKGWKGSIGDTCGGLFFAFAQPVGGMTGFKKRTGIRRESSTSTGA